MAKMLRIAFLTSAAALLVIGCEAKAPGEGGSEPKAVQEAPQAEQAEEGATATGAAATAEAGEVVGEAPAGACPHAKGGECPKGEGCDGNCAECPYAKAGTCPHAKAGAAGEEGSCCGGATGAEAGACPHAKAGAAGEEGSCCGGAAGAEAGACPHAKAGAAGEEGSCCGGAAGAEAKADYADEEHCPFGDEEAGAKAAAHEGCGHHGEAGTVAGGLEGKHYGAEFEVADGQGLSAVLGAEAALPAEPVRVSGTIDEVCQKAGCWFVLKDGDETARITMGHAFTVPKDSKGRKAEVEGTVTVRTFTEEQVKHLEADRGGDPSKVDGSRKEYVLQATAAAIEG